MTYEKQRNKNTLILRMPGLKTCMIILWQNCGIKNFEEMFAKSLFLIDTSADLGEHSIFHLNSPGIRELFTNFFLLPNLSQKAIIKSLMLMLTFFLHAFIFCRNTAYVNAKETENHVFLFFFIN